MPPDQCRRLNRRRRETQDEHQKRKQGECTTGGIERHIFVERTRMVAAERQVLTRSQWQALEDQLRARPQRDRSNQYPMGGRGRGGRGGRRPGWPG